MIQIMSTVSDNDQKSSLTLVKMLINDHYHSDSALGEVDIVCKCCYGLGSTPHLLEKSADSGSCQNPIFNKK